MRFSLKFLQEEEAATSIEYCMCMFFIIVVCIGAVHALGFKAADVWGSNSSGIWTFL